MPQTTPERRARWPGGDQQAMKYLRSRGYVLQKNWLWAAPPGHTHSSKDVDALDYLIEEWDFGGVVESAEPTPICECGIYAPEAAGKVCGLCTGIICGASYRSAKSAAGKGE